MQIVELQAAPRSRTRKSEVKASRRAGTVPAVMYGSGKPATLLAIDEKMLRTMIQESHGTTLLLDVLVEGKSNGKAVIRNVQRHPVTRALLHCDLLEVNLERQYTVSIPIHFEGDPIGVRTFGGILQETIREIEIKCRPMDIPEAYTIDVTNLSLGESLHVSDIRKHGDEEFLTPSDVQIVAVIQPMLEEEPEEAAEGEVPEVGEVGKEDEDSDEEKSDD